MRAITGCLLLTVCACGPSDTILDLAPITVDLAAPVERVDLAFAPDLRPASCSPTCEGATAFCNSSLHCVACLADADCPLGTICRAYSPSASACVPGCSDDKRCALDGGVAACCDGACVDLNGDGAHCGGCGKACLFPHAKSLCAGGQCALSHCDPRWGDCNQSPVDGCEANLRVDTANCGACGAVCSLAHGVAGCADACYLAACDYGYGDCNGDDQDGCEATLLSDGNNCGGCGNVCGARPHAQSQCQSGACALSCSAGWADCNHNVADGCEIQIAVDAMNCGACGAACANIERCINGSCTCPMCNFANAKSTCVNKQCTFVSCLPGFGDCDANVVNGCETDLGHDGKNCGACGATCPKGQGCNAGACAPCVAAPAGAVAWWPGEGNANELLANDNGAAAGGVTYGPGMVGQAFVFDGTGQITAPSLGLPTGAADRTLELWARIDAIPANESFLAGWGTFGQGAAVYVLGATKTVPFFSQWGQAVAGGNLVLGQWAHLAVSSANGTSTLYVNGVAVGSGALKLATTQNTSFLIGKADNSRRVQGAVDEITVYNRALSANEISTIYEAGALGKCH